MSARKSLEKRVRLWLAQRAVDRRHGRDGQDFVAIRVEETDLS